MNPVHRRRAPQSASVPGRTYRCASRARHNRIRPPRQARWMSRRRRSSDCVRPFRAANDPRLSLRSWRRAKRFRCPPAGVPHQSAAPLAPKITAEDRTGGAAVEALKASRLDFLFRSKPAARPRVSAGKCRRLLACRVAGSGSPSPIRAGRRLTEGEPQPAPEQVQEPEPAAQRNTRSQSRTGWGAAHGCDPEIRRGRRHGLYALCRRIDRSQASAWDGALRLDRRGCARISRATRRTAGQGRKRFARCGVRARVTSCSCSRPAQTSARRR